MSVFISWSGENSKSHQVAKLLREWLPRVIQRLGCYVSSNDIHAGSLWVSDLFDALNTSTVGIMCLTVETIEKPWVNFEAGALAKQVGKPRVCPLVIDVKKEEVLYPLGAFNAKTTEKEDMYAIVKVINDAQGGAKLSDSDLRESFESRWESFASELKKIQKTTPAAPKQDLSEMVAETLSIVRGLADNISGDESGERLSLAERIAEILIQRGLPVDAQTAWHSIIANVRKNRPLIQGWVGVGRNPCIVDKTLSVWFSPDNQLARESVMRERNFQFIQSLAASMGLEFRVRDEENEFF